MELLLEADPLKEFFDAIRSPKTRRYYELRLAQFLDYAGAKGDTLQAKARDFTTSSRGDFDRTTFVINSFLQEQKARAEAGEITASTISIYIKPLKLFCEMNDIPINWKKISRKLPTGRHYADDRAPTREEIATLLTYADRRIRPAILVMVSSGIRIGAWESLNWGHVEPVKLPRGQDVVAARMKVYPGDPEAYETFISGEAYRALQEYVKYRESQGEKITSSSPILRDLFPPDKGARGQPHRPKRLEANGVKRLLEDALFGTGLRTKLAEGKHRHEFQGAHGLRKFFKSAAERRMKSLHVEMLLGHDTGLNESYYRPKEEELLADYVKALPDLTFLENPAPTSAPAAEVEDLRRQLAEIKEKQAEFAKILKDSGLLDKQA